MGNSDPTLDFLLTFEDASNWVIVENVPICTPHERTVKQADGSEQHIVVTEEDLPDIADQLNAREVQYGVPAVVTIGHRQQTDPAFPEKNQPDIVGYARHHHVAPFGPTGIPAVMGTVYYKRSDWNEAKKYPFRSMDFYPNTKKVTGIALLKRDPYLPMGMVTYAADGQEVPYNASCYAQEPPGHKAWLGHFEHACQSHPVLYGRCGGGATPYSLTGRAVRTVGRAGLEVASVANPMYGLLRSARRVVGYASLPNLPANRRRENPTHGMATKAPQYSDVGLLVYADEPDEMNQPGGKPVANANEAPMPDKPAADAGGAPPPDAGADPAAAAGGGGPPPGYDQWLACFEFALQSDPRLAALAGGGDAGAGAAPPPPPGGELGGAPVDPAMPKPGEQNADTGRNLAGDAMRLGGTAMGAVGGAPGMLVGNRLGAAAARNTVERLQESAMPASYAAAFQHMQRDLLGIKKSLAQKDAQIAALTGKSATKDAELLVYQLLGSGVKALFDKDGIPDPKAIEAMTTRLAKMPEDRRTPYVQEIQAYWAKDDSYAYAAQGAPTGGGFIGVPQMYNAPAPGPGGGEAPMTVEQGDQVIEYMRVNNEPDYAKAKAKVLGKK